MGGRIVPPRGTHHQVFCDLQARTWPVLMASLAALTTVDSRARGSRSFAAPYHTYDVGSQSPFR